ncbi:hypothetical protein GHT06_020707 [Daphnia sinensis]|uniref:Flap endonuclease 1 n=1 Tax=Daphnia sinensis TaxID=1820382 RepID=A0AAD5PRU5_9CRUS|nr:hypothetical protein GHT06_020707 [Daphnia sinensis]
MGIKGLTQLIGDSAPAAIKENEIKNYFGRKVAIDASMSIYQFLIAVRSEGAMLTSADGETTSHLMGLFYRTIRMVDNGIKPVYVFDGKPPEMKGGELNKRAEKREEATKQLAIATDAGDTAEIDKMNKRLVKVNKVHTDECKQLLTLMGVPYIEAPCEAEAQCAAMVKAGKVYATATEDMDSLTFGSNILLRYMTYSEAKKMPIKEFHLDKVLQAMSYTMDEFIDLCIMLGCDYCDTIKGIGAKRAKDLIDKHRCIEKVIENLDTKKYAIPEDWPYQEARRLFKNPDVLDPETIDLKWNQPDEEGLVKFLCGDKNFNEERIRGGAKKLCKAKQGQTQGRLDTFFKVLPSNKPSTPSTPASKRKAEEPKKGSKGGAKFKRAK